MDYSKFIHFILDENPKQGQKAWIEAYDALRRTPAQGSLFLSSRELSGFVAGFETYGHRIADFLQQVHRYVPPTAFGQQTKEDLDSKKALTGQIARRVLLPLLDHDYQHLHDHKALLELLISVICLSDRSCLDLISAQLGALPELLAKLISGEHSSRFLSSWEITNPKIMQGWTGTAVSLAEQCESDHGVLQEIEKWRMIQALKTHLYQASDQHKSSYPSSSASFNPWPQGNMRRLSIGESGPKNVHGNSARAQAISLSSQALSLLEIFGIDPPDSERTLLNTIESLEGIETSRIMKAVINSFPCRLCLRRGYQEGSDRQKSTIQNSSEQRLESLDLDSFEGLLGSSLGIWKISLSAQALKDLRHSKKEGMGRLDRVGF